MSIEHVHYIKVTPGRIIEDDGEDSVRESASVKFECRGSRDNSCHRYPDCECEYWGDDHEKEHPVTVHDECWMQGWFDAGDYAAIYAGDDSEDWDNNNVPRNMDREGFITAHYEYDGYVEWEWAS